MNNKTESIYCLPERLTYAALVDIAAQRSPTRYGLHHHDSAANNAVLSETEITELMQQRAIKESDQLQQFPFAPRESGLVRKPIGRVGSSRK